jgi:hypothetical protein
VQNVIEQSRKKDVLTQPTQSDLSIEGCEDANSPPGILKRSFFLPLLPELEPHHANQDDGETGDETEQDQHVSVVTIRIEAE